MTNKENQNAVWKTYPEFPFIQANQFGEVRTVDRTVTRSNGRKRFVKGRVLKQCLNRDGYLEVSFGANRQKIHRKVHRIVMTCFLLNPKGLPEVNHKDNNRTNNRLDNLEWCTSQYNTAYREKCGVSAKEYFKVLRKPLFAANLKTFKVSYFVSQHEAARQLGVSQGNIYSVLKGRRKQTGGHWFCYADENATEKTKAKFGDETADKVKELMNRKL